MLNTSNVFAIALKSRELLESEGNCGRKIRRFLSQVLDHSQVLNQTFMDPNTDGVNLGNNPNFPAFAAVAEYAAYIHDINMEYLSEKVVSPIGTNVDRDFQCVGNAYVFEKSIASSSVSELKEILRVVAIVALNLEDFAVKPRQVVDAYILNSSIACANIARQEHEYQEGKSKQLQALFNRSVELMVA